MAMIKQHKITTVADIVEEKKSFYIADRIVIQCSHFGISPSSYLKS